MKNNIAVISNLEGGLGNQMFQYAVGRSLSIKLGCPLKLDLSWFRNQNDRQYALNDFSFKCETVSLADKSPSKIKKKIDRIRNRFLKPTKMGVPVFLEKHFHVDDGFFKIKEPAYLQGYWQSELYFKDIENQIRKDFRLEGQLTDERQKIAKQIQALNAISVHVRRGDYVTNPSANKHHGTCPADWYKIMMSKMAEQKADPTFFVFSDDPEWAKSNLPNQWPCQFIQPSSDGKDQQDMALMSFCNHHIIANSSFSWWGAWLNPNEGKTVFAPQKWFSNKSLNVQNLIPSRWERF